MRGRDPGWWDDREMADDRSLAMTFDSAADRYQQARPDYPEELFDVLVDLAGLSRGDRLLEIGCATGKATLPLARRGFALQCVEPGPALVEAARRNLSGFAEVVVHQGRFEDLTPTGPQLYDAVIAATAWHWLDPQIRYRKAWDVLRPGGHLAFWSATHVFPDGGDPIFRELQDVYEAIGEGVPGGASYTRPGELPDERDEIEASGLFEDVTVRHVDWEVVYDAEGYLALLDTFSGHIAMEPWQRARLYGEIRQRLAERPNGSLRRGWGAVLHVARRRDAAT